MKEKKIYLTQQGFEELKSELDNLINVKRPANIQAIKEARALGDLSENSDYDAARNDQAQLEGRIKELEYKLEHCNIAENHEDGVVAIGSVVTIEYDDGEVDEYKIVGSLEADPFENKISNESPIGKAVIGHKQNETVQVESPNGAYPVVIKEVK